MFSWIPEYFRVFVIINKDRRKYSADEFWHRNSRLAPMRVCGRNSRMSNEIVLQLWGSNTSNECRQHKVVWRLKESENHYSKACSSQHDRQDMLRKGGGCGVGLGSTLKVPPAVSFTGSIKCPMSTRHSLFHAHCPQQVVFAFVCFLVLVIYFVWLDAEKVGSCVLLSDNILVG